MRTVRKVPDFVVFALTTALESSTQRVRVCPDCGFEVVDPFAEPSPWTDEYGGPEYDYVEFEEDDCLNCGGGY